MDLKKIELNHALTIGLIAGIVLLAGFIVFLVLQPASGNSVPMSMAFAAETHESIAAQLATVQELEAAVAEVRPEMADRPQKEQTQFEATEILLISFREELEWISARETAVFVQLEQSENPFETKELLETEAALFTLLGFVVQLNEAAAQRIDPSQKEAVLESVDAVVNDIKAKELVSAEVAAQFASELGVDAAAIRTKSKEALADLLAYKKQVLVESAPGSMQQFVEAFKLSGWFFLLQTIETPVQ